MRRPRHRVGDTARLGGGPIADAELLAGGTQNVLVRFTRGGRTFVLRRPPPHLRKNSNETMRREARVLASPAASGISRERHCCMSVMTRMLRR